MNNRRVIVVAGALIVVGLVVVLALRALATRNDAAAPPPAAAAADAPQASTEPAAQPAPAAEPPPPWLQQDADGAAAGAPKSTAAEALRAQQMQQLQKSMTGMVAAANLRAQETNAHMRQALDTLQAMNDPAVTSQIDIAAVRRNLEISIQMQTLAQELQQLMQQPNSEERKQQVADKMAKIRQLQTQLDPDVRAPGSTLPPLAPAIPGAGG